MMQVYTCTKCHVLFLLTAEEKDKHDKHCKVCAVCKSFDTLETVYVRSPDDSPLRFLEPPFVPFKLSMSTKP